MPGQLLEASPWSYTSIFSVNADGDKRLIFHVTSKTWCLAGMQAAANNRGTASASNVPSLLEFDADAPSDPSAPSAATPSQQGAPFTTCYNTKSSQH